MTALRRAVGGLNGRATRVSTATVISAARKSACWIRTPANVGPTRVPIVRAVFTAARPADGWSAKTRELQTPCTAMTVA